MKVSIGMPDNVNIVAQPSPFSLQSYQALAPSGMTIAEMLTGAKKLVDNLKLQVYIDDVFIPQDLLHKVKPKPGQTIYVKAFPQDGGGGEGGKNPLRTILTIAVIAAALFAPYAVPFLTGGAFTASTVIVGTLTAGALATAVVGTAGMLLVNALVPPRVGSSSLGNISSGVSSAQESPNYSISGARNQLQPYGVVPTILGTHRIVPPLGAQVRTEILGGEQYLRILVVWGYGPLDISEIRIGDDPIENFDEVQIQTRQGVPEDTPLSLYPDIVNEQSLGITLTAADGFNTRTTDLDVDEISVDLTFPSGLVTFNNNGNRTNRGVQVLIQYRPVGTGGWTTHFNSTITAASTQPVRRGFHWNVPRGQYEVRIRRVTADNTNSRIQDTVQWSALRTFTNEDPIQFPVALARSAIRIKATDQLNAVVDQINALVKSRVRAWNPDTQTWQNNVISNNPADLFRHVLQSPANENAVPTSAIDLEALQEWHAFCVQEGFTFNHVRDFESSVWDTLADVCAAGRATPGLKDGKWLPIVDNIKPLIVQHFTPRNSWDFEGNKVFESLPHGWRVRFVNEEMDYQQDERIVYDDGFTEANATKFEALEFPGVTDPAQIWKHGRFHIAQARLRPEVFSFYADLESLICTRGDRIKVSHDVILVGLASGRILELIHDDGPENPATGIRVDELCPMEAGKTYVVRVRTPSGSFLRTVETTPGDNFTLSFTQPLGLSEPGHLFMFGESGLEADDFVVKAIEPAGNGKARLTVLHYNPALQNADQGAIPAFDTKITLPPVHTRRPAVPTIKTIQSDLTVATRGDDGSITENIVITCEPPANFDPRHVSLQAQVRRQGTDDYSHSYSQGLPNVVTISNVIGGEVYDIRIRRVATAETEVPGAVSDWHEQPGYTVIGKTDLPEDVQQIWLESGRAVWDYEPPLDFKGFRLRFNRGNHDVWADAEPAHEGYVSETVFNIDHLRGGPFTLLIKAFDSGGRESANAAKLVVDLGDPLVDNVILNTDYKANRFFLESNTGSGGNDEFTKLLLHMDGEDASTVFIDSSTSEHIVTAHGSAQIDTENPVFGTGSLLLNNATDENSTDFLSIPDSDDFKFGSDNFTVDLRATIDSLEWRTTLICKWSGIGGGAVQSWLFDVQSTGALRFVIASGEGFEIFESEPGVVTEGVEHHFAFVRTSTLILAFVDGEQVLAGSLGETELNDADGVPVLIGANYQEFPLTFQGGMVGTCDEVRISKGVARWTANFTPPTSPYTVGSDSVIGTVTNGAIDPITGDLEAVDTILFWGDPATSFWEQNNEALFWGSLFGQMIYEMFFVPQPLYGGDLSLLTTIQAQSYRIRYRTNGDNLLWNADPDTPLWSADEETPLWGPLPTFRAWPGVIDVTSRERYYFRITTDGGALQGRISRLIAQQDVDDIAEFFNSISIPPQGLRLPITQPFRVISNLTLTLEDDGGEASTVKIIDKSVNLGPLVQAFNNAGAGVTARVDAEVRGF